MLLLVVAGLVLVLYLVPIPLWIAAWASGAYVGLFTLIGMRLRRVPPTTIVTARISAVKAGLDISINDLEAHFLAGGNVVQGRQRHDLGRQGQHSAALQARGRHRPGRTQRAGSGADVGPSESDRNAARSQPSPRTASS